MINLDLIVGARPNFMKIAPIIKAIERYNAERETWNLEPETRHTKAISMEQKRRLFKNVCIFVS